MAISLRGWMPWLALMTACSGGMFNVAEPGAGGQAGASGSRPVGDGGGGQGSGNQPGAAGGAGAGDDIGGGGDGGMDPSGAGGQGGSPADPVCEPGCGAEEQCVATSKGSECRCAGALVKDGQQ